MEKFFTDFVKFTEKIKNGDNFAYARYADGEVLLMKGNEVGQNTQAFKIDNWSSPNKLTSVGNELIDSLMHTEPNYYYAISSVSDNISDHRFLMDRIKSEKENITFANLWINSNYQQMKEFYTNIDKECFVICNHRANINNFPFKIKELFPFPDNCIEFWESSGSEYISNITQKLQELNNETFFISAGPISEIIIHRLYSFNPNNQYIDVGSSMDEFVHGKKTRPYMEPNSFYAKQISVF
jgi:hypothetical protein